MIKLGLIGKNIQSSQAPDIHKRLGKLFKIPLNYQIFDGRRRYDLKIKNLGKENLINDRPKSFSGNVTICGVKMIPIGGHRLKSKWKPKQDKFSDFKIYFGKTSSGLLFPVRMNLERWFGTVVVRLINKNM